MIVDGEAGSKLPVDHEVWDVVLIVEPWSWCPVGHCGKDHRTPYTERLVDQNGLCYAYRNMSLRDQIRDLSLDLT